MTTAVLCLRSIPFATQIGDGSGSDNCSDNNPCHQTFSVVFPLRLPAKLAEDIGDVTVRQIIYDALDYAHTVCQHQRHPMPVAVFAIVESGSRISPEIKLAVCHPP